MPLRLRAYIGAMVVLAIGLVAWQISLAADQPPVTMHTVLVVGTIAAIGFIAELLAYQLPLAANGSFASLPYLAALLLMPSWIATLAVGASMTAVQMMRRREPSKLIFNVSQVMVSIALGGLVHRASGWAPLPDTFSAMLTYSQRGLLLACGPAIVVTLTNTVLVAGVVAIASGQQWWRVWQQNTMGTLVYLVFTIPMAWALAGVGAVLGGIGVFLVSLPLLAMRQIEKGKREMERMNDELLELLVKTIETRDPYTSGHSLRVAKSVEVLAQSLRLPYRQQQMARMAGLLHDVGKATLGDVLSKPGRLNDEERLLMQSHAQRGADIVRTLSHLQPLVAPIQHHHEAWDGSGYPTGLAGDAIPLVGRLIAIADTIDAMATTRPYRGARTPEVIYAEIARCRGTQFDPRLTDIVLHPVVWQRLWAVTYKIDTTAPEIEGYTPLGTPMSDLVAGGRPRGRGTPWMGGPAVAGGLSPSTATTLAQDLAATIADVRRSSGPVFPKPVSNLFPLTDDPQTVPTRQLSRITPTGTVIVAETRRAG